LALDHEVAPSSTGVRRLPPEVSNLAVALDAFNNLKALGPIDNATVIGQITASYKRISAL
jgi:hypothetical protein